MQVKDLQRKRALRTALLVLLLSVVGMGKMYADWSHVTIGDLLYKLNHNTLTAIVEGHIDGTNATGSLVIPSSVTYTNNKGVTHTYDVTRIGGSAFTGCSGLTGELIIPNSVISIDDPVVGGYSGAFAGCTGFTGDLVIPNSVITIGTLAFRDCSGFTSLTIGNSVTHIYNSAFLNCSGLSGYLTIPETVTYLGAAFGGCNGFIGLIYNAINADGRSSFQNINGPLLIGDNVESINEGMFSNCSFIGDLIIPNSVTTIGKYAFHNCNGFTGNLTIGNSVTSIGDYAFQNCSGFTGSLTIPNSVTYIGRNAFKNCSNLTAVYYDANIDNADGYLVSATLYPPFEGCGGSLTIGDNVEKIPSWLFSDGSFTGNLTIYNSVKEICGGAFDNCSGFTGNLTIPNSVTSIGVGAFSGCSGFTGSLTIGNSVTSIGNYAFGGLGGFSGNLTIPNSVTSIGASAFSGCSGFTGNLNIPNSVTTIGASAFYNCSGFDGTLTLPDNESFTTINGSTFYGCSGLIGNLVIPNSVTTIGGAAFYNCSGFSGNLTIPNSVISISDYAFRYCSGFTGNLVIGNSVTTIGREAFRDCSGFATVHYNPTNCNDLSNSSYEPFYGCGGNLVIGNNVQRIPNYMFYYGNFTGDLIIPNSVTSVGAASFSNCRSITSIHFNASNCENMGYVEAEGQYYFVFYNNTSLNEIVIGDNVTQIPIYAFANHNSQHCQLVLGDAVGTIGYGAFYNSTTNMGLIGKLEIPSSVNNIDDRAFYGCRGFQFIRSYIEVPPIVGGEDAFFGIDRGIPVGVPCGFQEDYEVAEYWSEFTNYTESEYFLVAKANPEHLGRAVIVQQPDCNTTICIVRAIPNRGCRFLNWTCNGEVVTQIHSYAFTIDEDKVMVANFEPMKCFTGGGGTIVWSDPANWEPEGVPTDTMGIDIQSDVIIDTDVNVGSIYNYGNHVVTVMPNAILTVDQTLGSPNPFGLVIEDGGQVVHHSEGVMATVRKTVDAYDATNDGWNLISFPLVDTGYVASVMNLLNNDYDLYYYDEPTHYWMNQEYTANNFNQLEAGKGYLYANSGVQNCVFDQAVYVTDRGLIDGHDASVLQGSQGTTGFNATQKLADDFIINTTTVINGIEVYAFQTNSDTISTFTGLYAQIYDGNPMNGGQPIWGDMDSNILTVTNWTNCYRTDNTFATNKPIMKITADNLNIELEVGCYYLVWKLTGGTWGIPVAIPNTENTGNGLQYWQGSWNYALDGGTEQGVGFAFRLYGTSDQSATNNASFSFVGELESGSAAVSVPLSYTESAGQLKGFNLVGNPFVHNVTTYGSTNVAEGCYQLNETHDNLIVSEINEDNPLQPAEGFFVKATGERASVTFNPGRGIKANGSGSIRVELSDHGKLIDRLIVKMEGEPLEKLSLKEQRTKVFATQNHQEIAIVPCEGNEQPVNFKAAKDGTYTINVNTDNMEFDYLHLIDNLIGADVDLLVEPSYSFDAKTSDYASRFRLVFNAIETDGPSTGSGTFAFINNGNIIVTDAEAGAVLQIVDVTGRILVSIKGDAMNRVSTNGMTPGVYVLRLINGNDVKTQRIVID